MRDKVCELDLPQIQRLDTSLPFTTHKRMSVLFTRAAFQAKFSPTVNGHSSTGVIQSLLY